MYLGYCNPYIIIRIYNKNVHVDARIGLGKTRHFRRVLSQVIKIVLAMYRNILKMIII